MTFWRHIFSWEVDDGFLREGDRVRLLVDILYNVLIPAGSEGTVTVVRGGIFVDFDRYPLVNANTGRRVFPHQLEKIL